LTVGEEIQYSQSKHSFILQTKPNYIFRFIAND